MEEQAQGSSESTAKTEVARRRGVPPRYRILRHLATGGMASVHLAVEDGIEGLRRPVVIKQIRDDLAGSRDMVNHFVDEVRLTATLQHPNIVQVYDFWHLGGAYGCALEYVHGENLRTVVRQAKHARRRLTTSEVISLLVPVCAGLHYAHERRGPDGEPLGVVHRDISPANLLVAFDGSVKVADFGIAKASRRATETRAGVLKGKLRYMSPEQCLARDVDRRSDVFSLSVVLYELACGVRPFEGNSDFEAMRRVVEVRFPPPRVIAPELPPELEAIILRGLGREAATRFPSVRELQLELEAFARRERLAISQLTVAALMDELFGERELVWGDAPPRHDDTTIATDAGADDALDPARVDDLPEADWADVEIVDEALAEPLPPRPKEARRPARRLSPGAVAAMACAMTLALYLGGRTLTRFVSARFEAHAATSPPHATDSIAARALAVEIPAVIAAPVEPRPASPPPLPERVIAAASLPGHEPIAHPSAADPRRRASSSRSTSVSNKPRSRTAASRLSDDDPWAPRAAHHSDRGEGGDPWDR